MLSSLESCEDSVSQYTQRTEDNKAQRLTHGNTPVKELIFFFLLKSYELSPKLGNVKSVKASVLGSQFLGVLLFLKGSGVVGEMSLFLGIKAGFFHANIGLESPFAINYQGENRKPLAIFASYLLSALPSLPGDQMLDSFRILPT